MGNILVTLLRDYLKRGRNEHKTHLLQCTVDEVGDGLAHCEIWSCVLVVAYSCDGDSVTVVTGGVCSLVPPATPLVRPSVNAHQVVVANVPECLRFAI